MLLYFIFLFIGLLIVIKAADYLIDGASSIASIFRVSPLVIGLTIVAFGTSSPELVVSIISAFNNSAALAFGNVIGSNIFNIAVILALSSIIYPLKIHSNTVWKEIPMSLVGAIAVFLLGLGHVIDGKVKILEIINNRTVIGQLTLSNGIMLLIFFIIFIYYTFGIAGQKTETQNDIKNIPFKKSLFYILLGLAGLVIGSRIIVKNAVYLADFFNLSEKFIGLTIIAIGTSLPELATNIAASYKKKADIAVGNILGSNIFNIFLILGTTAIIKPVPIMLNDVIDLGVMVIITLFLFASYFIFHKGALDRREGIILIIIYIIYLNYLFIRT